MEEFDIKKTKMISSKVKYPKGANSPTIITKYKCLCGWGKIVEEDVRGFNDHFVTIKCFRCRRKYHPFVDIIGDEWRFYKKD